MDPLRYAYGFRVMIRTRYASRMASALVLLAIALRILVPGLHTHSHATLPTGAAIVIFGGGTPTGFALAQQNGQAQVASSGSLGLNNGGDSVSVGQPSPSTTLLTSTTFGASTDQVSLNRAIDADSNSSFVDHNLAETAAGLADAVGNLSPGLRVNGTAHQGGAQGGGSRD